MKNFISLILFLLLVSTSFGQTFEMTYQGLDRSYLVHLPSGYTGNQKLPLIIAMHGGFGSSENIERQSQLSIKADKEHFIVVYPQGYKGGLLKISGYNAGGCCGWTSKNNVDDVGFISAVLDEMIAKFAIDTKRVYATGMSNGGMMSYRLACELSDRIAAIAPVASTMVFPNCQPSRPVPVIHFHSYLDTHSPYLGGIGSGPSKHYNPPIDSVLNAFGNRNHCKMTNDTVLNNEKYSLIEWKNCDCGYEIHEYITRDGGHSWPGGNESGIVDTASVYISATDLMWEFFKKYTLECDVDAVDELSKLEFHIFPNPSSDIVTVEGDFDKNHTRITVYNAYGKLIPIVVSESQMDFSSYSAGIYFIVFQSQNGVVIKKVVIQ